MAPPKTIGSREVHAAIERLAAAIGARHRHAKGLLVLGIANGGIPVARRLCARLGIKRVGDLDISFHRDDIGKHPIPKEFTPTLLPGDVNGASVLLVDDVLFTGRTVKAALDELFDHGRPATVELAVLVDRGGRRLPVAADFVGMSLLRGKTIVNLFLEPSTRTRMAFDMAAKRLSADVIAFDAASSSTQKGETLRDTAENIQALNADMIVIRHAAAGSPSTSARSSTSR
jgi:pyrimidine operon attenuation protein/uracil phosphoribosyltransferase